MATIKSSLVLHDRMTAVLNRINVAMSATVDSCESMAVATGQAVDVHQWDAARVAIGETGAAIQEMESYYRSAASGQDNLNKKIHSGTTAANGLVSKIAGLVSFYSLIRGAGNLLDSSDSIMQTTARLNLMNDGLQSTGDLLNMVYNSAQNARGSLSGMASVVARIGNNVGIGDGKVFGSSAEVVAFSELIQKQMTIAGASATEADNAILQLSQGLASGTLRGEELNAVLEQAPGIVQNIADYIGVSRGEIKGLASDGLITADIVKNAMFNAADDINAKFETMPMTWDQVCQSMTNSAQMLFVRPVSQKIQEIIATDEFQAILKDLQNVFVPLANMTIELLDSMANAAYFVNENFGLIAPVVGGVTAMLGAYAISLGVVKGAEIAGNAVKITSAALSYGYAWATRTQASATAQATAAQWGLNTAILSSPLFWIPIIIIGIVSLIYLVIAAINKVTGSTISATGIIFGSVMWLVSVIINIAIGCMNTIIQFLWVVFVEPFLGIIEFVLNAAMGGFNSFGGAVANLIGQIISWFLSLGKVVTNIIDAIFGTNWTAGLSSLQNSVLSWGKSDNSITIERSAPVIQTRMESTKWFNTGYNLGDNLATGIEDKFNNLFSGNTGFTPATASDISSIAGDTGNISDSLDKTNEELSWIRDIAERDVINRFTTAEVKVDFTGMTNQISNDMDLDGVISAFTGKFKESLQTAAEGVY